MLKRQLFGFALLIAIGFGSVFALEFEGVIVKFDPKERLVTVEVDGKEKVLKLYKQAKFIQGKKVEMDAADFLAKIGKKGTPLVKISVDEDQITQIELEKKKKN